MMEKAITELYDSTSPSCNALLLNVSLVYVWLCGRVAFLSLPAFAGSRFTLVNKNLRMKAQGTFDASFSKEYAKEIAECKSTNMIKLVIDFFDG
ncbi:hypothetical protein VNO77_41702 [Canavalia gladiata]|uniref:Uncharacterized protein n=1 Tax=Canavalia gladiata TaxID=3824 RepID=A0AAN9PRS2_CANGL